MRSQPARRARRPTAGKLEHLPSEFSFGTLVETLERELAIRPAWTGCSPISAGGGANRRFRFTAAFQFLTVVGYEGEVPIRAPHHSDSPPNRTTF
jgi:hypothetical protein